MLAGPDASLSAARNERHNDGYGTRRTLPGGIPEWRPHLNASPHRQAGPCSPSVAVGPVLAIEPGPDEAVIPSPTDSKTSIEVHDYVDRQVAVLARMHAERLTAYASLGFDIPRPDADRAAQLDKREVEPKSSAIRRTGRAESGLVTRTTAQSGEPR